MPVDKSILFVIPRKKINRKYSLQQSFDESKRHQQVDSSLFRFMPQGIGSHAETIFWEFPRGTVVSVEELQQFCLDKEVVPADPWMVTMVNIVDPAFADEIPNSTYWHGGDTSGKYPWRYLSFSRWLDRRMINVGTIGSPLIGPFRVATRKLK